jgi:LmbE family N-acetylglucosaminyl deacetylase
MSSIYFPESVMAVVAHPDDIEFTCAGTVARWVKGGARAAYVLCTSGDAGIADPQLTRTQAAAIREAEALEAARRLNVADVTFLRYPDGLLEATLELRQKLVREIRRFRPEVVITGDPTLVWAGEDYINHPDHRAASLAAVEAVFPAAGQLHVFEELATEGLQPHKIRKLYCTNWRGANTFVYRRHYRPEDRSPPRPQEPDARLGPRPAHPRMGLRARQKHGDAIRRSVPRGDAGIGRRLAKIQGLD